MGLATAPAASVPTVPEIGPEALGASVVDGVEAWGLWQSTQPTCAWKFCGSSAASCRPAYRVMEWTLALLNSGTRFLPATLPLWQEKQLSTAIPKVRSRWWVPA